MAQDGRGPLANLQGEDAGVGLPDEDHQRVQPMAQDGRGPLANLQREAAAGGLADEGHQRVEVIVQAGRGQPAQRVYSEDCLLPWLLKNDNKRKHGWEKQMEQDLIKYNIDLQERKRFNGLPAEYHGPNEFVRLTNMDLMTIYDGVSERRCEALILKAKGKLKKDDLTARLACIKGLLLYAKPKRKDVQLAGGNPLPVPALRGYCFMQNLRERTFSWRAGTLSPCLPTSQKSSYHRCLSNRNPVLRTVLEVLDNIFGPLIGV
ncbi:uncharacterized protein LOC119334263 [Triticum dicoccoides]|uniref:uncharacterized protein LOC119334263 n=1 Tax=Triticum dicoccoides TaxID=85692 RepID=UPI000E78C4F5|nr:uncharacterized protein LOC119334263 [Triticum dicoccoides]